MSHHLLQKLSLLRKSQIYPFEVYHRMCVVVIIYFITFLKQKMVPDFWKSPYFTDTEFNECLACTGSRWKFSNCLILMTWGKWDNFGSKILPKKGSKRAINCIIWLCYTVYILMSPFIISFFTAQALNWVGGWWRWRTGTRNSEIEKKGKRVKKRPSDYNH